MCCAQTPRSDGYRGSPLGSVDQAMWKARPWLDKHNSISNRESTVTDGEAYKSWITTCGEELGKVLLLSTDLQHWRE